MRDHSRTSWVWRGAFVVAAALALAVPASAGDVGPSFSKVFAPDTIGPGSVSTLTFDIVNNGGAPVTDLAFSDTLPADVTIATPASVAIIDCGLAPVITAPDGGITITFADGTVGAGATCSISVNVTSMTPGTHMNVTGSLTSSAGTGGTASDDLIVVTTLPGFGKSFAPSSIPLGGRSTLTFTIDNALNAAAVPNLDFTDNLPTGMLVADPANASTDCVSILGTTLIAAPGTSVITLDANGSGIGGNDVLAAGASCTVAVDVTGAAAGMLVNVSSELLADFVAAGKASATLDVTVTPLALTKSFIDDPVPPGGSVELEFNIHNFDRLDSATSVAFTDDLTTALAGLTFSSLLANDCGGSVSGVGGTTIGFSGGTVGAEASCTVRVSLAVPAAATPGTYTNTTGAITATVGGSPVVGNMASEDLFVEPVPVLTKEFRDAVTDAPDPVINAGDDVVMRFTITNTSTTSGATEIAFLDELTTFLPFPVSAVLPPTACGGSIALIVPNTDVHVLSVTGGSLAAAPGAGSTCTFDVTLTIPVGLGPGIYVNTTEEITATVDGATRTGDPASDTFTVIAAPSLSKAFIDDPVAPGGTVTLEFVLTYPPDASGPATGISFTDDLAPVLAGLTANLPPTPDPPCGVGSSLVGSAGDTLLTLMGGSLNPGESCAFSVALDVPAGSASGNYTNTTSGVSATVGGLAATSAPAVDALRVAGIDFTKEFIGDPVIAGDTVILRFTLDNVSVTSADDATAITFTDNLNDVLPGTPDLTVSGALPTTPCGPSSSIIEPVTGVLFFTGGELMDGEMCTFDLTLQVPAGAADGMFANITSNLTATIGGAGVSLDPATDALTVASSLLLLSKEFTDDPVAPGDPVNLRFTLTNLDAGQAASGIAFYDDLGATLSGLVATGLPFAACGGTVAAIPDAGTIDFSGGSLAQGAACFFDVAVDVPGAAADGIYPNTTSGVTGTIGGLAVSGDPATDDLFVIGLLGFSKSFDGPTTASGAPVLTFTLTNPGPDPVSDLVFFDDLDAGLAGLIATNLPLADVCGSGSLLSGTTNLTLTGGALPPSGGTCSFDVDLLVPGATAPGAYLNTTTDLFQNGLTVGLPATATLTVVPPPSFTKAFFPDTVFIGFTSTLSFTIDNGASALSANALDFTDNLPAGVVVASPSNVSTTCTGGTLTATPGSGVITYSAGLVAAAGTCTVAVDVTATAAGSHINTTGDLTSTSGNSGAATATLTVPQPVGFSKSFTPDTVPDGSLSTLAFTIVNPSVSRDATGLDFTDNFPAGVVVATPPNASTTCSGGTLTAVQGTGMVAYTGGTVSASSSCTVTVDVIASGPGVYVNTTGDLTSSLGNSGTATDTVTVLEAVAPQVAVVDSIAATGGGLTECETAKVPITQLVVTFSEDMNDPPGNTDMNDVTRPMNYALVAAGPDRNIDTIGCGPPGGDDITVVVDAVAYAAGTFTSTVMVNGGGALPDDAYRLFACAELTDLAGNNLDGNGDGTGGDDFIRAFRLDARNVFDNGHLDCDLGAWDLALTDPSEITFNPLDVDVSNISGSASAMAVGPGATLSLTQCFTTDSMAFDLSGFARIQTATVSATLLCRYYDAAGCTGVLLDTGAAGSVSVEKGSTIGVFEAVGALLSAPLGSASARCGVEVSDGVAAAEAFADQLQLELGIFADGFESGDTSAWSSTVP